MTGHLGNAGSYGRKHDYQHGTGSGLELLLFSYPLDPHDPADGGVVQPDAAGHAGDGTRVFDARGRAMGSAWHQETDNADLTP